MGYPDIGALLAENFEELAGQFDENIQWSFLSFILLAGVIQLLVLVVSFGVYILTQGNLGREAFMLGGYNFMEVGEI